MYGEYLGKGRLVSIQGSIKVDNYQDQQGNRRTFTKVSAMRINSLDSNKDKQQGQGTNQGFTPSFEPSFQPQGLDPQGFQAIDDDDIPF